MYDMYPWDSAGPQAPAARRGTGRCPAARPARAAALDRTGNPPGPAVRALQVALDRRDNGGAAGAPADR